MEKKFIIIGMDDSHSPFFRPEALQCIRHGRIFSGGERHQEIVAHLLPRQARWITVTAPLDRVFKEYEELYNQSDPTSFDGTIVVFASGDPLFFGFANTIRRKLPQAGITLYPSFNSLQMLAHRAVISYDDMHTVSLTGRPWHEFDRALIERTPKIGVLTDREHTPAAIAARMLEYGYTYYTMYVGEHLGHETQERVRLLSLRQAAEENFAHPNNLILVADASLMPPRPFGIPDEEFTHLNGRAGMITKSPIRLLTLQALELNRRRSFWDIGFCTGSVSIEARLQFPHLSVVSFEVRPEGEALMHTNSRRFGTPGITVVCGDFLQANVSAYPRPDAVFIGGHGGCLKEILLKVKEVLQPGGCVVFNSVSPESKEAFIRSTQAAAMHLESSLHIAIDAYNPIEQMKATLS